MVRKLPAVPRRVSAVSLVPLPVVQQVPGVVTRSTTDSLVQSVVLSSEVLPRMR